MQKLYIYMYKEVYLHKSALISQRFLQKMVSMLLKMEKLDPAKLWLMTDAELIARVYMHKDERLQFLYESYRDRNLPRTGMVIRLKDREFKERIAGKQIKVIGEGKEFFEKFMKHTSAAELEALEAVVGKIIKMPAHRVVIVPTLTPWRFVPKDILYHDEGRVLSLGATQKEYFEMLRSEMSDYMAVRVCVIGDRGLIYKNTAKILKAIKIFNSK